MSPGPSNTEPLSAVAVVTSEAAAAQPAPGPANDYRETDGVALLFGNSNNNRCISVVDGAIVDGSFITLADCDGSLAQQWLLSAGHYSLGGTLCMTAGDIGTPSLLRPCTSDANQFFLAQSGSIVSRAYVAKYGLSGRLAEDDNTLPGVPLISHHPNDGSVSPNNYCFAHTAVPRERGFLVRPESNPNACLSLTFAGVAAVPCVATDLNQRFVFEYGRLIGMGQPNMAVATPSNGNTLLLAPLNGFDTGSSGFWLGDQMDMPGLSIQPGNSVYSNVLYDANTEGILYEPSSVRQDFWLFGGTGTAR